MTNSVKELEDARCIFVTGSNTTSSHPLVATRIFRAKQKGAKLIVADPRRIQLADMADIYVSQKPGTDVALLNGIMHVIMEKGLQNQAFIDERTEAFDEFKETLKNYPPEKAADICGVAAEDIIQIAEWYATAETSSLVYCLMIQIHRTA